MTWPATGLAWGTKAGMRSLFPSLALGEGEAWFFEEKEKTNSFERTASKAAAQFDGASASRLTAYLFSTTRANPRSRKQTRP